jgi:membrane-bound lytic murein transglycosylase A
MHRLASVLVCALVLAPPAVAAADNLEPVAPPANFSAACDDMDLAPLAAALDQEIAKMQGMSGSLTFGKAQVTYKDYAAKTLVPLAALARKGKTELCAALPKRFAFYRNPGVGAGKFTAYQNPVVKASRTKKGPYQYPLYKRPPGALASLTTAEVIAGGLNGKGLEIIYLADATEVNLVHVEGSANVLLDDGKTTKVSSDGHNGQQYQNVSKLLLADNKIPKNQVTPLGMTRARKYFQDHPAELWTYWSRNPHYVFFKEVTGAAASGKYGELTAGRSLAVDGAFMPLGAAVWFHCDKPTIADNKVSGWAPYGRVALAQDTGSGIKGAGRVDVFYGSGDYAMAASAVTDRPGEIYALLAK